MATKVRIELLSDGIRELLCSQPIAAECRPYAAAVAIRSRRQSGTADRYTNKYPSVTTVLGVLRKLGLEMWFKNNTAQYCDEESRKGKRGC